jgi:hypothetical protein
MRLSVKVQKRLLWQRRFFFGILIAYLMVSLPAFAEQRTLTGILNGSDQFISSSGDVYEIADTEAGMEMLYEAIDASVDVTGDVFEDEEINFISVESFKITATPSMNASEEQSDEDTEASPDDETERETEDTDAEAEAGD